VEAIASHSTQSCQDWYGGIHENRKHETTTSMIKLILKIEENEHWLTQFVSDELLQRKQYDGCGMAAGTNPRWRNWQRSRG
jgi:hypothetical protein